MAKMRVISSNVIDTASLSATSAAVGRPVSNLQTHEKSEVWRSVGTSATITAIWGVSQLLDSVILGYSNLTTLAVVTVNAYANVADTLPVYTQVFSIGTQPLNLFLWGISPLMSTVAEATGSAQHTQCWLTYGVVCRKVEVIIEDPQNTDGFIQLGKLFAGLKYEAANNPAYGSSIRIVDASKITRSEALTARIEKLGQYRAVDLDLNYLPEVDAAYLLRLANLGKNVVFISIAPESGNSLEQVYSLFCIQSNNSELTHAFRSHWTQRLTFEEV